MAFEEEMDHARKALALEQRVKHMQNAYVAIEKCRVPVVVGVDGACVGAGCDLITSCDIVYCTKNSFFAIKEVDIGMIADLGVLQRLPIVATNWSLMKEYALTGDRISSAEAQKLGLVSRIFDDSQQMRGSFMLLERLLKLADSIASKSPVAITGIKNCLNGPRNILVQKGLDEVIRTNMSQLFANDLVDAVTASLTKSSARFQKL